MPKVRQFSRLLSMQWSVALQYRVDAISWMLAEAAVPLVSLAIWVVVSRTSESSPAPRDVFTYYIIIIFVKLMTDAWNGAFLAREILEGKLIKDLIKPIPAFWHHVAEAITEKIFKLFLPLTIVLAILLSSPDSFSPQIFDPARLLLFSLSIAIAMVLQFSFDHNIGMLAFWLEDAFQIRRYKIMLESLASGVLIPFAFMPPLAVSLLGFLPMRFFVSAPAEILLNQPVGLSVLQLFIVQGAWLITSLALSVWLWQQGLKRYAIPGQ